MKRRLFVIFAIITIANVHAQKMNEIERSLINSGDKETMMRVLQTTVPADLKVLQSVSTNVDLKDDIIPLITQRMLTTVKDTASPGVGIAAPQIGIKRNIIWVQRFDKTGEPFEVYLNPKIVWRSVLMRKGTEGCLSIPDIRGDVMRNYTIRITYYDLEGKHHDEMVEGFTAVIFQHETDHLVGILFTDRLAQQERISYSLINSEVNLFLEKRLRRQ